VVRLICPVWHVLLFFEYLELLLKTLRDFTFFFKIALEVVSHVVLLIEHVFQVPNLPFMRLEMFFPSLLCCVIYVMDDAQPGRFNGLSYLPVREPNSAFAIHCHQMGSICTARGAASAVVYHHAACVVDMPPHHLPFRVPLEFEDVRGVRQGHRCCCC